MFDLLNNADRPITRRGVLAKIVGTSFDNRVMLFIMSYRNRAFAVVGNETHQQVQSFPVCRRIEGRRREHRAHRVPGAKARRVLPASRLGKRGWR